MAYPTTHVHKRPHYLLFVREGKATIVTGHIDTFTETGIEMKSGEKVEADFIISATGLTMQKNFPFSTMKVTIDGEDYKASDHLMYNGIMIGDVPNFAFVMGYTNASWTLKADIASLFFAKLLNYMRDNKVGDQLRQPESNFLIPRWPRWCQRRTLQSN